MGTVQIDRNGLEVLSDDECVRLLRTATLGRVAVTSGALPTVLPVNFRVIGERILFRTGRGTKLDAATRNAVVAFEVDDIDDMARSGWSVVVTGVAREVTDLSESEVAWLPRWAPGQDGRVVGISLDLLSGRRIVPCLQPPEDHHG